MFNMTISRCTGNMSRIDVVRVFLIGWESQGGHVPRSASSSKDCCSKFMLSQSSGHIEVRRPLKVAETNPFLVRLGV
jgi:hypothetical protein